MNSLYELIVAALRYLRVSNGTRRANRLMETCLACGSANVMVAGGKRLCIDCQYEGDADGGGDLTHDEVAALYKDEGGGLFR